MLQSGLQQQKSSALRCVNTKTWPHAASLVAGVLRAFRQLQHAPLAKLIRCLPSLQSSMHCAETRVHQWVAVEDYGRWVAWGTGGGVAAAGPEGKGGHAGHVIQNTSRSPLLY